MGNLYNNLSMNKSGQFLSTSRAFHPDHGSLLISSLPSNTEHYTLMNLFLW